MKIYYIKEIILSSILLGLSQVSWAACTQTLSPGADVAKAISSAAAGSTICLNSGDYGNVTLSNISQSSAVTLQSATGVGATINLTVNASNNLTFKNLTISGLNMWGSGNNTYISVLNNTFTGQMQITGNGNVAPQHNIIDGNTFDGISVCANCYEGRLQIWGGNDLIVSNNHFGKGGDSDGINMGGYGTTIGPGNIFDSLLYMGDRHVDAIQADDVSNDHITIIENSFTNGGSYLMFVGGTASHYITVKNNVFVMGNYAPAMQFPATDHLDLENNTLYGGFNFHIDYGSSYAVVKDNILIQATFGGAGNGTTTFSGLDCTNCTFTHNLFTDSSLAVGTNNIIGTPTFVGGSTPTTWSGYQLTSGSLGYQTASNGMDMGTNYYGTGTLTAIATVLAAPSNLHIQ